MTRRGVTVIEVILYVAVLAIISGMLLNFTVSLMARATKVRAVIQTNQNVRFAMEKIAATVRNSKDATVPADGGGSGPTLTLTMPNASLSPTVFAVTDGVLTMRQGTGQAVPLTSADVRVTSIDFRNLVDPVSHARTSPGWIQCSDTQRDEWYLCVICRRVSGNWTDMCWNQYPNITKSGFLGTLAWLSLIAELLSGTVKVGSCLQATAAKSVIRYQLTVSSPSDAVGAEWGSTLTFYGTATIPRQN